MTEKSDDDGNLLSKDLPSDTDSQRFAEIDFWLEVQAELKPICTTLIRDFKVPRWYSADDILSEVMTRFWMFLPRYREEATRKTVLYKITKNHLIDMSRKRWPNEFSDPDDIRHKDDDILDWIDQQVARREKHNRAAEAADQKILNNELLSKLNPEDQFLAYEHFQWGKTATEIATELKVTRQNISKKLKRISAKLGRNYDEGASPDSEVSDFRNSQVVMAKAIAR